MKKIEAVTNTMNFEYNTALSLFES